MTGDGSAALTTILEEARALRFLGPGPVERQLRHAADLARVIGPFEGHFLDLGSGGGLPGLVLAIDLPGSAGVLLDSHQRRCAFLAGAVERLHLETRVEVVCGRAERLARDAGLRGRFDLVVARSFGRPAVTAECAVGFLRVGAALVVTEPPDDGPVSDRWPEVEMARLGFVDVRAIRHGETGAMRAILGSAPDERWPRREGVPTKRPLW